MCLAEAPADIVRRYVAHAFACNQLPPPEGAV